MTFLFLDTETTGLDPHKNSVWEIGWAFNMEPIQSAIVPHHLDNADSEALIVGDYHDRVREFDAEKAIAAEVDLVDRATDLMPTLVCANPHFDASFLRVRWGHEPWHYRLLDIETWAAPMMGSARPCGLNTIAEKMSELGHHIPAPTHSAWADVATLRAIFLVLHRAYFPDKDVPWN